MKVMDVLMPNNNCYIENDNMAVHFEYAKNNVLTKTIINKMTDDALTFSSFSDFEIQLVIDRKLEVFKANNCVLKIISCTESESKGTSAIFEYSCEIFKVAIKYEVIKTFLFKNISITTNRAGKIRDIYTEKSSCPIELSRGGEGQPVFCGDKLFVGIEFPASNNYISENMIFLKQSPYINVEGESKFSCYTVVFGLNSSGTLAKSFINYIRAMTTIRKKPLKIYCDWGLHDEISDNKNLEYDMVDGVLSELTKIIKNGFKFDYYLMDAFWYEFGYPYTKFNSGGFPDGILPLLDRMKKNQIDFGLWFDVNFCNTKINIKDKNMLRNSTNEHQMCFSQPYVQKLLEDGINTQIRDCNIKMIKFDFAHFDCECPTHHNHSLVKIESKEPAIDFFIKMINRIRQADPEMKILAYNGFTTDIEWIGRVYERTEGYAVSPWWCFYIDYVYCGDPRPSDISANSLEKSIVYYTDAMISQFSKSLFPNEFIDDHGSMVANTGTIYGLVKRGMYDNLILNVVRGTGKMQFYGDIHQINSGDVNYLKWCENILNEISQKSMKTNNILGDPSLGEVYGYSNSNALEGYITVINPTNFKQQTYIMIDDWMNNNQIEIQKIYCKEPLINCESLQIQSGLSIELESNDIAIYKWKSNYRNRKDNTNLSIYIDELESVLITVPEDTSIVEMYFLDKEGKPLRCIDNIPENIKVDFLNCKEIHTIYRKIWSGISWIRYEIEKAEKDSCMVIKKAINNANNKNAMDNTNIEESNLFLLRIEFYSIDKDNFVDGGEKCENN
jgi:hypothetical protein